MNKNRIEARRDCLRCPSGEVHNTGSTLVIFCAFQSGIRQINDVCNLPESNFVEKDGVIYFKGRSK